MDIVADAQYHFGIRNRKLEEDRTVPKGGQHVVLRDGKWAVRRTGANRASRRYDTQKEAIEAGREIASREQTELFIHGEDGRIREWNSFGSDSNSAQG